MSSNTFAVDARILECKNCGAPLIAPVAGGQAQCEYCGTVAQVAPRRDLRAAMGAPQQVQATGAQAAQQRLFILHQQAASYDAANNPYAFYRAPPGLEQVANRLVAKGYDHAEAPGISQPAFQQAVAAAEAAPGDPLAQRRLYWMAMMMSQVWAAHDEFMRQRAALETAMEVLQDPGHRYILNTEMAKAARNMGDLDSADAWLAQCAPDPWHLDLDNALRITAASLALLRQQWDKALGLVGRNHGEIPFEPSRAEVAGVVRTAALEGAGDMAGAEQCLLAVVTAHGRDSVKTTLDHNDSVVVARATFERLAARNALPRGPVKVGRVMIKGCSIAGIIGMIILVALIVLPIVFMPLCSSACGGMFGYQDVVMERLRACPAAQAALGDDIRPAATGMSCGNAETSGSTGHASWSMPVKGSRGRGTYQFTVNKMGGPWQIQSATLTVDGQMINVATCSAAVPMTGVPMTPPVAMPPTPTTPPMPGTPAMPPAAGGGTCARMAACCAVAGGDPSVGGMCRSLPQLQASPAGEMACAQLLRSAAQALSARRQAVPPQCQ